MIHTTIKRLPLVAAALLACFAATPSRAEDGTLLVPVDRSALISLPGDVSDVLVSEPTIADVVVHGSNKVSVLGKKIGHTSIRIFDKDKNVIREIVVTVGYDLPSIRKSLKDFFPDEQVGVKMVNTNLAVVGNVSSNAAATKVLRVVREYLDRQAGSGGGAASSQSTGGAGGSDVLNLMTVASNQQVMLRVRVGEIQRSTLRRIGVNVNSLRGAGNFIVGLGTGGAMDPLIKAAGDTTATSISPITVDASNNFGFLGGYYQTGGPGQGIGGILEALETQGLFKVLAEPNLVAVSGEKAEFLAGGEFPVPIAQPGSAGGATALSIDYKTYGVAVQFTPQVLTENRIRLAVQPEVSELTSAGAVQLGGFSIPALSTRRAKTTIELAPGESFMIAGLIKDTSNTTVSQMPGVAEIPILSALFRTQENNRSETELVIAVTPYLVDPVKSTDIKLPTDDFRPASTMETFFYGALGSLSNGELRTGQKPLLEGPIGYMVD